MVRSKRPKKGDPFPPNAATRDHILPQKRGGTDDAWNIKLACQWCNEARAITGDCIGALACAKSVMGYASIRDIHRWWRVAQAYSLSRYKPEP